MNRVLLVEPIYNSGFVSPNVALGKIEALLNQNNVETEILDFVSPECENNNLDFFLQEEKLFFSRLKEKAFFVDVVYLTTSSGNELKPYPIFPRVLSCIKILKELVNPPKIVVGGALINLYCKVYGISEDYFSRFFIDALVVGNEINVTDKIIELLNIRKNIVNNDIFPKWIGWDLQKYPDYFSIMYNVGCPYKCDFCFEGKIFDKKLNNETINSFINTINYVKTSYGINNFIIEDSVFISIKEFDILVDKIKEQNIKFAIYVRISEVLEKTSELMALKEAGCVAVIVGIETLDNDILEHYHKGLKIKEIERALIILKDLGLKIQGCFMLGFPDDTLENMDKTIDFAVNANLDAYRWHIYQPNYRYPDVSFYAIQDINVLNHLDVQLNIPDCCLADVCLNNSAIAITDEHFLVRAKGFIKDLSFLAKVGYKNRFTYKDIYEKILKFPNTWILNEDKLYSKLF